MKTLAKSTLLLCFFICTLLTENKGFAQRTPLELSPILDRSEVELCLTMVDTITVMNDTSFRRFLWQIYDADGGAKATWKSVTTFNSTLFPDDSESFLPIPADLSLDAKLIRCLADTNDVGQYSHTSDTVDIIIHNATPISGNGNISGPQISCSGPDTLSYKVSGYANASYYQWLFPNWADTIYVSLNADSIVLAGIAPASGGGFQISVTPISICGEGKKTTKMLNVFGPIINDGSIIGDSLLCKEYQILDYTIVGVQHAQYYHWIIPSWASIVSASGDSTSVRISGTPSSTEMIAVIPYSFCEISDSVILNLQVYENLTPGIIANNQDICYLSTPATLSFSILPSGAGGIYSYQWQDSTTSTLWSSIPFATNQDYSPPALIETHYYRVLVSSGICGTTLTTNQIRILVYPEFEPGNIGDDQSVCMDELPEELRLTTMASGGTGTYSYQWYSSVDESNWTLITGEETSNYQPPILHSTHYYRLGITSLPSCGSGFSNTVALVVKPSPVASEIIGQATVCRNQVDVLYSVDELSPYLYSWSMDPPTMGAFQDGEFTNITYVHWGDQQGTAILYLTQINANTDCKAISSMTIEISSDPAPDKTTIIQKPNSDLLICEDESENLHYQWGYITRSTDIAEIIPGATTQYVMLPHAFNPGLYNYFVDTYFTTNGSESCITRSYMFPYSLPINLDELSASSDFPVIYPNPATDNFRIRFPSTINKQGFVLQILDFAGSVCHTSFLYVTDATMVIQIPDHITAGGYLIRLITADQRSFTAKLTVIK